MISYTYPRLCSLGAMHTPRQSRQSFSKSTASRAGSLRSVVTTKDYGLSPSAGSAKLFNSFASPTSPG